MERLKRKYTTLEEIPEIYRELYTQQQDQWVLTGIDGFDTHTADNVTRLEETLRKEKEDHRQTKARVAEFRDLKADEVFLKLDELDVLKAQVGEQKTPEQLQKQIEAHLAQATGPLQRELDKLRQELADREALVVTLQSEKRQNIIRTQLQAAAAEAKMLPEAVEDFLVLGERLCEVTDDGRVITRDQVGVTPGLVPLDLARELQPKKPHWWQLSQGGGAVGTQLATGIAENPWSKAHWNLTKQGEFILKHGEERASQVARSVGSSIDAIEPPR